MNKIILALILMTTGVVVPSHAKGLEAYEDLLKTVEEAGVTVFINPAECFAKTNNFDGYYHSVMRKMVICQDNAKREGVMTGWTDNDLDTVRHEVHHLVQDCVAGEIADGELGIYFSDKEKFIAFVDKAIGEAKAQSVIEAYSDTTPHTRLLELEAFSVAEAISPEGIEGAVVKYCF